MQIYYYFLWLMLYSSMGWLYESTICSLVNEHRLINRGFLMGPICPIYGFGALINIVLLRDMESPAIIFLLAMVTSGILEYITSYLMEELFGRRWWDYSRFHFNIKGRVCPYICIIFGIANVILLKVVHPVVSHITAMISTGAVGVISIAMFFLLLGDIIFTTSYVNKINFRL